MSLLRDASSSRCAVSSCSVSARLECELAPEAHALGHLLEELVDRLDADRREHLLAVAVGEAEVAHCSAISFR